MAAHRSPETVGCGAREAGAFHRDLQDLLLVEDDAERLLEDRFQTRVDVHHRLSALLTPEVRMHRITLDRSRADDGDLHDEIVERLRTRAWQRLHLRPALDLKDANRIGLCTQLVDRRVFQVERVEAGAYPRAAPDQ